jgi:hypothetical protein
MATAQATASAFEVNLFGLAEATNKELSDALIVIWRRKFGDLPEEVFGRAVALALDSCTWFPTPAEFGRYVEAALSPEDRAVVEELRLLRGYLAAGMLPIIWTPERLALVRAAVGLPPPSPDEMAYLVRERQRVGLDDVDWGALPQGPVEVYLRDWQQRDGGALLALAAGGRR